MFLISGLGNPGLEYRDTLHNLGFMVLDELAARSGLKFKSKKCGARIAIMTSCHEDRDGRLKPSNSILKSVLRFKRLNVQPRVVLAKPQTYMNLSGKSIACLKGKYGIKNSNIVVVSDDLNLERGQIRIKTKGSSGGHKGLQSIIDEIKSEDFLRFRIGIGPFKEKKAEDYVLSSIEAKDRVEYNSIVGKVVDAVEFYLKEGVEKTMSKYNLREII